MDFVLVFTVVFVHRVFSSLRKMYFRPIFYKGVPASPCSPLRPKKRPTGILIGKTQYFIKVFFFSFHLLNIAMLILYHKMHGFSHLSHSPILKIFYFFRLFFQKWAFGADETITFFLCFFHVSAVCLM